MAQSRARSKRHREETHACEIELLAAVISLTSPPDACRAADISRTFLAAADSDAVWSSFLPRDLPEFAEGELPCRPPSKKALFQCLSDRPSLLPCKLVNMWLDRTTGAKCYTLSPRVLHILWGDGPKFLSWKYVGCDDFVRNKRFWHAAIIRGPWWLEIRGTICSMMLSQNMAYTAYMVFKLPSERLCKCYIPFQEASVSFGARETSRQVCLRRYMEAGDDGVPRKHILESTCARSRGIHIRDGIVLPWQRADGWMEVELGEFYNEEGYDGEVSFSLMETKQENWKNCLVVWGIEIRVKQ
ncbi:unnamed protein product [Alopecurus aequalis]